MHKYEFISGYKFNISRLILFILFFVISVSCVTQKHVEYLQNTDKAEVFSNKNFSDYILKPYDELYVQITSLDDAAANIFSSVNNQNFANINAYGAALMSHTIDSEGNLDLPVIGKIRAEGRTLSQLKTVIKDTLSNILNQPAISIKLVNQYVSVLGEVRNPGHFVYTQDKMSIFDAIGMAGDITDYGNRKSVILVRNKENEIERKQINLSSSEILSSDSYFIRPGDIIYVKPLRNKFWGLRQFPFTIILSSITTTILVLNYVYYQ